MGVFDNYVLNENDEIVENQWIEWDHFMIPNNPQSIRTIMRKIMAMSGHCLICTSLDGCYLLDRKRPPQPLHLNCDCKKKNINHSQLVYNSESVLPIVKLTNYVLKNNKDSKGKRGIFESLGFSIKNAYELQGILEHQAISNYIKGEYVLKKLDKFGQRLAIPINISGHLFYSGWLLCPEVK